MNNKSLRLRITNKKLKNKLKEYNKIIFFKDKTISSLAARKDAYLNQINCLNAVIEDQRNEIKYLENENKEHASSRYDLAQENLGLKSDLEFWKKRFKNSDELLSNYENLSKKYEENVNRLSMKVAKLTKENEYFKSKGIANKVKNIFKKR